MVSVAYLLVEGKNNAHVIKNLAKRHGMESPEIQTPGKETESIEELLRGLPLRLQAEDLQTLGIVVDANQDILARWQAIRERLISNGYSNVPKTPLVEGWVSNLTDKPRVGVWLMPDNQLPGMLEDFVRYLIPPDDVLRPKAEAILQEIEQTNLNRYKPVHHPKALIHTWLAWQETPGMPMGQAITAQALRHDSPTALSFVAWLKRLFELSPAQ
jgi:hypothetical protein